MSHLHPDPVGALSLIGDPSADSEFLVATGAGTFAYESGNTVRTSLGLTIGTDVQAWDAQLDDIAALAITDGNFIVADGANWVVESGNTARTSLGLGTGDSPTFTGGTFTGNVVIQGTIVAQGITEIQTETVLVEDNYLDMNTGHTTAVAQEAGLTFRYLPTATVDTVAAGGFATTTTVVTTGSATFSAGDIVAVDGADDKNNNGLYEVVSHVSTTLTIDSTPTEGFSKSAFTVDTGDTSATITKVNVSVIQVDASGDFEIGKGSTTPITFAGLPTLTANNTWTGTQDFQAAITTDAVNRNIRIITSTVAVGASDHVIVCDDGAGDYSLNLPAATGSGRELVIKYIGNTDNVTVDGNAAETIDGAATVVLKKQYESITIIDYASGLWVVV